MHRKRLGNFSMHQPRVVLRILLPFSYSNNAICENQRVWGFDLVGGSNVGIVVVELSPSAPFLSLVKRCSCRLHFV